MPEAFAVEPLNVCETKAAERLLPELAGRGGGCQQMTNGDAAAALGLEVSATSKPYTRALVRLKRILAALPGAISEEGS